MSRLTSYDSWEEVLRDMNKARYDADRAVLRWQRDDLMPGTFAIRIADGLLTCPALKYSVLQVPIFRQTP